MLFKCKCCQCDFISTIKSRDEMLEFIEILPDLVCHECFDILFKKECLNPSFFKVDALFKIINEDEE